MKLHLAAAVIFGLSLAGCSNDSATRTPSPPGAKVFIIEPKDGAEVASPVTVRFGVEGINLVLADSDETLGSSHNLLIDTKLEDVTAPISVDANHQRFRLDQTETTVELKPGKHTLQLVLGDYENIPHDPVVQSDVIMITVK